MNPLLWFMIECEGILAVSQHIKEESHWVKVQGLQLTAPTSVVSSGRRVTFSH